MAMPDAIKLKQLISDCGYVKAGPSREPVTLPSTGHLIEANFNSPIESDHFVVWLVNGKPVFFGSGQVRKWTKSTGRFRTNDDFIIKCENVNYRYSGKVLFQEGGTVGFTVADKNVISTKHLAARLQPAYPTGMFGMYLERVLIPELQRVSGALERKAAAVGCVKLLTDSQHLLHGSLAAHWPALMQALISLFELPPDESSLPDDHFVEVEDAPGYQAQYAHLTCARGAASDPLAGVADPKRFLAERLGAVGLASPGLLPPRMSALSADHRNALLSYLAAYSVQLC